MRVASSLEQLIRSHARPASVAQVGGFRPPDDPLWSWFGHVRVGLPGEKWPVGMELPMLPLCQLNLSQAPHRPPALDDVELLAIWLDQQTLPTDFPARNGNGWCLRAYADLQALVEIEPPPERERFLKPFPILWQPVDEDFPDWEDLPFDAVGGGDLEEYESLGLGPSGGTKIGGRPSLVQSGLSWAPWDAHPANPEYVLQIDTEPKSGWAWADSGVGYFGRGTGHHRDDWALEWQSY